MIGVVTRKTQDPTVNPGRGGVQTVYLCKLGLELLILNIPESHVNRGMEWIMTRGSADKANTGCGSSTPFPRCKVL